MDEKLYTDDFKASVYTSFTIPPQRSILASDRTNGEGRDMARHVRAPSRAAATWYTRVSGGSMAKLSTTPVRLKDIASDLNVSVMRVSKVVRGCADVGA